MQTVRSADGTTIAFDWEGTGPLLVLVGGALTDRTTPRSLSALLRGSFTVVSYDRRGRGGSGDSAPYAIDREIEDLDAVVVGIGGRPSGSPSGGGVFVYGHSSGAILSLEAATRGVAVTRLAVYEPPFLVGDARALLRTDLSARLTGFVSLDRRADAVKLFLTEAVGVPAEIVESWREAPTWPTMEGLAHTLAYDIAVCGGDGSLDASHLGNLALPTLVMDGGASPDWARHAARTVADAIPGALYRTIQGQDHRVSSSAIAPMLAKFFLGGAGDSAGGGER